MMTYEELYNKAVEMLNLDENMISDYRPASPLFISQLQYQIPNSIIIWLNTGEQIIFIDKGE